MSFTLKSTAFHAGDTVPTKYTGDGADVSPPLAWSNPPEGTVSFALVCDDPDAPRGTWVHWVLYDLPADTLALDEAIPATATLANGAHHGKNDFHKLGYGGPAPPPGKPHRYFFRLYALDTVLGLPSGQTRQQLDHAMQSHILAEVTVMAKYQR